MKINYREVNVDRFLEMMAIAKKFDFNFKFHIKGMPKLYNEFLEILSLQLNCEKLEVSPINESDFVIEFPEFVNFNLLFKTPENISIIVDRILKSELVLTEKLDDTILSLLKNAVKKLNYNKDEIQNCIDLASVISSMDSSTIKAEHIAESIQYNSKNV